MEHLPQVQRIVQRIAAHLPASVDREDLINSGIIGLIQSAERYDHTRKNTFMTYAQFRIRGAVISELRARDYLSRQVRRSLRELEDTYYRLEQENNGEVSDEGWPRRWTSAWKRFMTLDPGHASVLSAWKTWTCWVKRKKHPPREMADNQATDAFEAAQFKEFSVLSAGKLKNCLKRRKWLFRSITLMNSL